MRAKKTDETIKDWDSINAFDAVLYYQSKWNIVYFQKKKSQSFPLLYCRIVTMHFWPDLPPSHKSVENVDVDCKLIQECYSGILLIIAFCISALNETNPLKVSSYSWVWMNWKQAEMKMHDAQYCLLYLRIMFFCFGGCGQLHLDQVIFGLGPY